MSITVLFASNPGSEANAEEAPDFKEADKDKYSYRRKWEPEANALSSMRFRVSFIFWLKITKLCIFLFIIYNS